MEVILPNHRQYIRHARTPSPALCKNPARFDAAAADRLITCSAVVAEHTTVDLGIMTTKVDLTYSTTLQMVAPADFPRFHCWRTPVITIVVTCTTTVAPMSFGRRRSGYEV